MSEVNEVPRVLNKRRHGIPAGAVYVGRPSKWGNPFSSAPARSKFSVQSSSDPIAAYRAWIVTQPALVAALPELRGRHLVCWCAPAACHADVLLECANAE